MSNPPSLPPQQQRSAQQQQRPNQQEQSKARNQERQTSDQRLADIPEIKATTEIKSGITTEEAMVVEGAGGAKNIRCQWIDVYLPGGKPVYFIVNTLPENELQVMLEQRSWKKTYSANGRVQTDVTPIAPVGTTGKLVAMDTTTGEEFTQNFIWRSMAGPSLFAKIVAFIKSLFTNPKT